MPRDPHRQPATRAESDDSGSFGGLADYLEPDADEAVTSLRHVPAASMRHLSTRMVAPAQVQDFAFADTVYATEHSEDEPAPPSGPIFVQDSQGNTQYLTPLAFRLPMPADDLDLPTRLRVLLAQARHAFHRSVDEMRELWRGTHEMVEPTEGGATRSLRRALALWSLFHWSRTDFVRAAMIGVAVFITAATVGATTLDLEGGPTAASSGEVRARHTLDQHTGKSLGPRSKR